jgi:RND family efflux transporter MFP subunit
VELHSKQAATGQQLDHAGAQSKMAEAQAQAAGQDVSAAESDISRVEALKSQAAAAVQEARFMLDHTLIRAPFGGRVIKKMMDVGDMASPGVPLFVIEVSGRPELHAEVSESLLSSLHVSDKLSVVVDALGARLEGEIREIVPLSDPSSRTVQVKVTLPQSPGLVNGLFGRLLIPSGRQDVLVVPFLAVREVGQLYLVDVSDGKGHAARRFVTLGERHEDLVEVLSGLKEGEEVVVP